MKKKTNHKIMKQRNTKRNTKRKINKKNKSSKRRKTLKINEKIKFTRKKLYGGAGNPGDPILNEDDSDDTRLQMAIQLSLENEDHIHPNTPEMELEMEMEPGTEMEPAAEGMRDEMFWVDVKKGKTLREDSDLKLAELEDQVEDAEEVIFTSSRTGVGGLMHTGQIAQSLSARVARLPLLGWASLHKEKEFSSGDYPNEELATDPAFTDAMAELGEEGQQWFEDRIIFDEATSRDEDSPDDEKYWEKYAELDERYREVYRDRLAHLKTEIARVKTEREQMHCDAHVLQALRLAGARKDPLGGALRLGFCGGLACLGQGTTTFVNPSDGEWALAVGALPLMPAAAMQASGLTCLCGEPACTTRSSCGALYAQCFDEAPWAYSCLCGEPACTTRSLSTRTANKRRRIGGDVGEPAYCPVFWKATVAEHTQSTPLMIGVIGRAAPREIPANDDPTCFGWDAYGNYSHAGGEHAVNQDGYTSFVQGDVLIFKLDAQQLSLRVERLGAQIFTLNTGRVQGVRTYKTCFDGGGEVQYCTYPLRTCVWSFEPSRVEFSAAQPDEEY